MEMNFYIIKRKEKERLFGPNSILHKMKFTNIYIYIILFI